MKHALWNMANAHIHSGAVLLTIDLTTTSLRTYRSTRHQRQSSRHWTAVFYTYVCMYGRGGLSYVATLTTLWSGRELWLSDHTVHNIPAGRGVWVGPRSLHGMLNCRHVALCWRGIYVMLHSTHTILLSSIVSAKSILSGSQCTDSEERAWLGGP